MWSRGCVSIDGELGLFTRKGLLKYLIVKYFKFIIEIVFAYKNVGYFNFNCEIFQVYNWNHVCVQECGIRCAQQDIAY